MKLDRLLIVGDYHAVANELDECYRLADFIVKTAVKYNATIIFLGDQFHHHSIIQLSVQAFWEDFYRKLSKHAIVSISLVGNHDKSENPNSKAIALSPFRDYTQVIDQPRVIDSYLFVPYMWDHELFRSTVKDFAGNVVFCHQEFDGARYENGFYTTHGIKLDGLENKYIITGHIHKQDEYGNVWQPGSPRWRTKSDANETKGIWLVEPNLDKTFIPTDHLCKKILELQDNYLNPVDVPTLNPDWKYYITIKGDFDWISSRKPLYAKLNAKITTIRTDQKEVAVKESEGINKSLVKFFGEFKPQNGTPNSKLLELLEKRVLRGS